MLSIFWEKDHLPIKILFGEASGSYLGLSVDSLSIEGKIDTVLYYERSGSEGKIHKLEIFWNQGDEYSFETWTTENILTEASHTLFGKYFEVLGNTIYATS